MTSLAFRQSQIVWRSLILRIKRSIKTFWYLLWKINFCFLNLHFSHQFHVSQWFKKSSSISSFWHRVPFDAVERKIFIVKLNESKSVDNYRHLAKLFAGGYDSSKLPFKLANYIRLISESRKTSPRAEDVRQPWMKSLIEVCQHVTPALLFTSAARSICDLVIWRFREKHVSISKDLRLWSGQVKAEDDSSMDFGNR